MTNNFKKFLLLSVLTIQSFASVSYAATITNMDDVINASAAQLSSTPTYHLGGASDLSLAVSLGKPVDNVTTAHAKLDLIVSAANGVSSLATLPQITSAISNGVSGLAKPSDVTTAIQNSNLATSAQAQQILSAVAASAVQADASAALTAVGLTSTAVSGLATSAGLTSAVAPLAKTTDVTNAISSVLIPLKLTNTVDNIMDHVFGNMSGGQGLKFSGTSGATLASAASPINYTITAGGTIFKLFDTTGNLANNSFLTPAQKLTIFLSAVFGINDFTKVVFPTSTGYFGVAGSDLEDSGTVLNAVFSYVLGTNRTTTGTNNKFGGTGVFGRINSTTTSGTKLITPTVYFSALGIADASNSAGSADIVRLRALITDLIALQTNS